MEIRSATLADFEAITEVARETWHDTYDELDEETIEYAVDEWYTEDSMPLGAPGTVVLVAEVDDEVVGFTHAVGVGEVADILRMYVHPDHQGEGIGSALHERLLAELAAYDVDEVHSMDFASNDASRRFYRSKGFEETHEGEVEIDGDYYDEAGYTLEL